MAEDSTEFLFTCCQVGAEKALKQEITRNHPGLRFAFSRPGFVTFKNTHPASHGPEQRLRSVFARAYGTSIGPVSGTGTDELTAATLLKMPDIPLRHLHVWHRDHLVPGERGFEPFPRADCVTIGEEIVKQVESAGRAIQAVVNQIANPGEPILDCIVVDDRTWWIGWHRADSVVSRWPGGVPQFTPREGVVSRAYWKMQEALKWSRLPIRKGDHCVELGSSPGGACQALLERDLHVIGIDPAEMDPALLGHPRFKHVRARAADLKRREFAKMRWLMADANVSPDEALDAIEHIVTNRRVNIQGMLITLKLATWEMADHLDEYLKRINSWKYRYIRARQLAFGRREVCVLAVRRKHVLRQPKVVARGK